MKPFSLEKRQSFLVVQITRAQHHSTLVVTLRRLRQSCSQTREVSDLAMSVLRLPVLLLIEGGAFSQSFAQLVLLISGRQFKCPLSLAKLAVQKAELNIAEPGYFSIAFTAQIIPKVQSPNVSDKIQQSQPASISTESQKTKLNKSESDCPVKQKYKRQKSVILQCKKPATKSEQKERGCSDQEYFRLKIEEQRQAINQRQKQRKIGEVKAKIARLKSLKLRIDQQAKHLKSQIESAKNVKIMRLQSETAELQLQYKALLEQNIGLKKSSALAEHCLSKNEQLLGEELAQLRLHQEIKSDIEQQLLRIKDCRQELVQRLLSRGDSAGLQFLQGYFFS